MTISKVTQNGVTQWMSLKILVDAGGLITEK